MSKLTENDKKRKDKVLHLIAKNEGKIFSVLALRKKPKTLENGEVQNFMKMTMRTGVTKHLKGGQSTLKTSPDLISGYLLNKKGYRCFSAYNVLELRISGLIINFSIDEVLAMRDKQKK